ncbi:hypothetical protein YC2023_058920 [Brassica napus]
MPALSACGSHLVPTVGVCVEKLNYALLLSEMQLGQETEVGEYILKPKTIEREKTFVLLDIPHRRT